MNAEELFSEVIEDHVVGTTKAADIAPERVEWLWADRIPLGMVSVFTGLPGAGKSTILYDLAARVSRDGKSVLIATAEDHLAAIVRPRLEAAGADLNLVHIVTDALTLPDDVDKLARWIKALGVSMFTLDPLVAFVDEGVNTHRDHHVRRVLAPIGEVAEATGAAAIAVVHTNKGTGNEPMLRVSGSIGFTGAARSVVIAAEDPQDESRRIFAVVKSNLAEMPPALAYRLTGVELADGVRTSRVDWLGEAPEIDVRELLSSRDPQERSKREDALEFLRDAGVMDTPRLAKELHAGAEALGIDEKTLQRARRALKVPAWREGFQGPFYWGPKADTQPGQPHLVQVVQVGDDLQEQGSPTLNLDNATGLGEDEEEPPTGRPRMSLSTEASADEPEPGWMQIQREAGEVPETDEAAALERLRLGGPSDALVRRVRYETGGAA